MDAQPGRLFACRWGADDPREAEGFRIVEIASASGEVLRVRESEEPRGCVACGR